MTEKLKLNPVQQAAFDELIEREPKVFAVVGGMGSGRSTLIQEFARQTGSEATRATGFYNLWVFDDHRIAFELGMSYHWLELMHRLDHVVTLRVDGESPNDP